MRKITPLKIALFRLAHSIKVLSIILCTSVIVLNDSIGREQSLAQIDSTMSVEYLIGTGDMHGLRIAHRPSYLKELDLPLIGTSTLQWEWSVNLFDIHGSANNEATYGLSISPILQKQIASWKNGLPISLELGIGIAYVHEEKFGGVDIGSDYQFEDRLGLIIQLDEENDASLGFRILHYSNGGFNTKNPGLDYFSLVYFSSF